MRLSVTILGLLFATLVSSCGYSTGIKEQEKADVSRRNGGETKLQSEEIPDPPMTRTLMHALSACMALASFHSDAGLREPDWQPPITNAVMTAIEIGDIDRETFDTCVEAVRKEIENDASRGHWEALENVYDICTALAEELEEQNITGPQYAC